MKGTFHIHPDITKAETLPASFYRDQEVFDAIKEKIFLKSWQWIGDEDLVQLPQSVYPFVLLENYLTEPLLLTRNEDDHISCLTNVCTHRGNLVALHPGKSKRLICMYHGRRFDLDGTFESMPEFEEAEDFPRPCDNLHRFPLEKWGPFLFVGLDTRIDFTSVIEKMNERVGFLPLHEFKLNEVLCKDFLVHAHWALYCDNYLEGFHIPFVHEGLSKALDYGSYTTEVYDYCNLQIGYTNEATEVFDLPEGHIDYGKNVAAYYYWVFPNMMFNFYPWGLSVNVVKPIDINRTKVSFISYVYDPSKLDKGAGSALEKVEREDEFVVENVQKGVNSTFYKAGRFSPKREKGVHHFHRLLAEFLNQ
ncbi:aromatic ring-hydroxylating dioxygenase subunit alpha [Aureisphaera galaxeae]|uniref:aromatic ring-hydroxylating oxygenase subunit alpha n=1 Tax=Aureisphaera galaxeae TaxID=1538023 RepID=UPI00234FB99F|nr:aromatic ring-hydroxylating dioxygenase subunit alpha [Aureisphaera galaxeae]MDC8002818.1 aromatic ring-hydroxylating dioxygenase subunit alpha [Aureisphaera galaxeae]